MLHLDPVVMVNHYTSREAAWSRSGGPAAQSAPPISRRCSAGELHAVAGEFALDLLDPVDRVVGLEFGQLFKQLNEHVLASRRFALG